MGGKGHFNKARTRRFTNSLHPSVHVINYLTTLSFSSLSFTHSPIQQIKFLPPHSVFQCVLPSCVYPFFRYHSKWRIRGSHTRELVQNYTHVSNMDLIYCNNNSTRHHICHCVHFGHPNPSWNCRFSDHKSRTTTNASQISSMPAR